MKATEIMQMFENQNVVNRADFTHEEYIQQLSAFQAIVSACVFDGDESYHLYNSITRLEELARSLNLKDLSCREREPKGFEKGQRRVGDSHFRQQRRREDYENISAFAASGRLCLSKRLYHQR